MGQYSYSLILTFSMDYFSDELLSNKAFYDDNNFICMYSYNTKDELKYSFYKHVKDCILDINTWGNTVVEYARERVVDFDDYFACDCKLIDKSTNKGLMFIMAKTVKTSVIGDIEDKIKDTNILYTRLDDRYKLLIPIDMQYNNKFYKLKEIEFKNGQFYATAYKDKKGIVVPEEPILLNDNMFIFNDCVNFEKVKKHIVDNCIL